MMSFLWPKWGVCVSGRRVATSCLLCFVNIFAGLRVYGFVWSTNGLNKLNHKLFVIVGILYMWLRLVVALK